MVLTPVSARKHIFERILIGGSAGSVEQLIQIFSTLNAHECPPIVVVLHQSEKKDIQELGEILQKYTSLKIQAVRHSLVIHNEMIYLATGNYHVLLNDEGKHLQLFDDEPYEFSKPSIDILFSSCLGTEAKSTKAILLSGANRDGAAGLRSLYQSGASCAVVSPDDCKFARMPLAALELTEQIQALPLNDVCKWILLRE
jgi:two-component system, chemotaxis family, protein-glutamate methylesterase/glutaminase